VLGSLLLTATASSAPLQGLWRDLPGSLVGLSNWLQRYVPLGGDTINPGIVTFGQNSRILGSWTSSDDVAFRVELPATETEPFYWLAATYATFEHTGWDWGATTSIDRAEREDLLAETAENPAVQPSRREVRVVITRDHYVDPWALSPETIRWVDRAATVQVVGPDDYLAVVELENADSYTVTALVPVFGADPGAITENRLRVASREYGSGLKAYLDVPPDAIGPRAEEILAEVLASAPADNPYDVARTMEAYLRSSRNFRYDIDVTDEIGAKCGNLSTVECFATIRAGFCQYYASTMAILLREHGIPTRMAQGFLPGDRTDGSEVVRNSRAHAWVQAFFPGYGWVDFDPTGGGVSRLDAPPSGAPESPTPRPSFNLPTVGPRESEDSLGSRPPSTGPGSTTPTTPGTGPFIAIGALLMIALLALGYVAWRRGPRPMHPDRAWGSIGQWAARFGLGPRASQTVYEYAGVLGDAMPVVRPELRTVANAKVEVSYGRRELGQDRMRAVAEAHRRLRLGLLRLAFRRPRWLRRRGPRPLR
jgi:transglutaminase-like putative cysteine protease